VFLRRSINYRECVAVKISDVLPNANHQRSFMRMNVSEWRTTARAMKCCFCTYQHFWLFRMRHSSHLHVREMQAYGIIENVQRSKCDYCAVLSTYRPNMGDITDHRPQRSAADRTCFVPGTHNSFGDRSFSAAGPPAPAPVGGRGAWPPLNKIWPQGRGGERAVAPRLKLGTTNTIFLAPPLRATFVEQLATTPTTRHELRAFPA